MLDVFEAQPQVFGLRMVFQQGESCRNMLRIENYVQDPRTLFLENQSSFGPLRTTDQLNLLEENDADAYGFLVEKAAHFVQAFDLQLEEE